MARRSPSPQPKKSISIDLMDLNKKYERKESPQRYSGPQLTKSDVSVVDLLGNDNAYKKELLKLLEKSKGTAYEGSVRKFLTDKLGKDCVELQKNDADASSYGTAEEEHLFRQKNFEKQRSKIDILAQPLIRSDPKISPRKFNYISTNTLGRQRPPPTMADHRKPIGSGPISVREFNSWLRKTNKWKQSVDDSISTEQQQRLIVDLAKNFHPKINEKSARLARRAHSRELEERVYYQLDRGGDRSIEEEDLKAPLTPGPESGHRDNISDIDEDDGSARHVVFHNPEADGDATVASAESRVSRQPRIVIASKTTRLKYQKQSVRQNQPIERSSSPCNVYDRLSARGRDYAQKRLHWAPPQLEFTFKPQCNEKSLKIAARRSRSLSTDRSLTLATQTSLSLHENLNPVDGLACDPDATPTVDRTNTQQFSPRAENAARGRSTSRDINNNNRPMSAPRRRSSAGPTVNQDLTFRPKLSQESRRLVARKNETFIDRLNKSVENFHVLSIVAKRSGSPGPGYYSNVNIPASASKAAKLESPGKRGYSFAKYTKDLDISLKY